MPLFLPTPCKVCGTGHPWPSDAAFCRNCGRPAHWLETARGRRRAAGVAAAVVAALLLLMVGLFLIVPARHVVAVAPVARAAPPSVPPAARRPVPVTPVPLPPSTPPAAGRSSDAVPLDPVPLDPAPPPPATVPARPGDTDLTEQPLAAYAGGPPGNRLTVHGLGVGVAAAAVPAAMLDDSEPDHLRDAGGNLYALDADHRVSEVHVRDPDLLARMPIDGVHALLARFGDPEQTYGKEGGDIMVYQYPSRGVDVRWNAEIDRIEEVVLRRPVKAAR